MTYTCIGAFFVQQLPAGPGELPVAGQPGGSKRQLQRHNLAPRLALPQLTEALPKQQPYRQHREARGLLPETTDPLPVQEHAAEPCFRP